ncbi:MAG: hypothetical protein LBR76_02445 [Oscillospiraceae bacterium]|jgi:hypothetical protein|nr:hypothetical protein [Oscillospiraceae bacterium]
MYKAYAGKVLDGKPAVLEDVVLPENASLLITILSDWAGESKTVAQKQGDAIKRFIASIASADKQFSDDDFAALENNRTDFNREVEP